MAREIRKEDSAKFIKKAEEFYYAGLESLQKARYNASVFDSTQSIILANDAFCIFVLGRRASDYREAIQLHVQASMGKESRKEILAEALEKRSEFGYTERDAKEKEASLMTVRSKRFLGWVRNKTGRDI